MFNSRRLVEVAPLEVVWVLLAFSGWLEGTRNLPRVYGVVPLPRGALQSQSVRAAHACGACILSPLGHIVISQT